jgi:hypothetical protein
LDDERVPEDVYVDAIDEVGRAAEALHDALDRIMGQFARARRDRVDGVPLVEIVNGLVDRGGKDARRSVDEAFGAYVEAVTAYRAVAIRELVDGDGMTFTDLARLTGVSRQMIARLYRAASSRGVGVVHPAADD